MTQAEQTNGAALTPRRQTLSAFSFTLEQPEDEEWEEEEEP